MPKKSNTNVAKSTPASTFPAPGTPNRPEELFQLGDSYLRSSDVIYRNLAASLGTKPSGWQTFKFDRTEWHRIMPMVVLQAFAVEMYFKCLYELTTGSSPGVHDFLKLYNGLPATTQIDLNRAYERRRKLDLFHLGVERDRPGDGYDLASVLQRSKDAFVYHRYIYEVRTGTTNTSDLGVLLEPLRDLIFQRRPDWAKPGPPATSPTR